MKLAFFLLALGVCINAASISISTEIVEKIELPSVSALLVTELLEVTFHVPSDLAQAIGHIFRDVPISLAKEMIAFIVKVFGDVTQGHLEALNQYMDQAIHIFKQVIEHINPKEVAVLIADEVLPEHWAVLIEKLLYTIGKRDLSGYVDDLIDAVIDWGVSAIENVVTSVVTGFFGLFGKRDEKGVVVDVLVNELIVKPLVGWVGGLFGKRDTEKGIVGSILVSVALNLLGKRDLSGYVDDLVDAIIDWGTTAIENVVTSLVTGFFGLFGKRDEKGVIIDAVVDTLVDELTNLAVNLIGSLFGKRQVPGL